MKSLFITSIILMVTAFVLMPVSLNAYTDQTTAARPPVSQPLVREGTLAVRLAEALKVGSPANETEAESMLSAVGIAPRNGWVADYPVTPDIVGELQDAVSTAAESGKIAMGKDLALTSFQVVMSGYRLTVRPGTSDQSADVTAGPDYPDPTVINNYYYDEGPPVVTYYAPPPDYAYLYSWVPYPFWWWSGFWFPGFFVLADFHRPFFVDGHRHFISNHFHDFRTGRISRIDANSRFHGGTFSGGRSTGWSNASARSGAQGIFNRSRGGAATGNSRSVSPSVARSTMSGASTGRTYNSSQYTNGRTFAPSSVGSRSRSFSSPSSSGRTFNAPSSGRAFSSFGGSRSFGGMHTYGGSRGSFGGGWRR